MDSVQSQHCVLLKDNSAKIQWFQPQFIHMKSSREGFLVKLLHMKSSRVEENFSIKVLSEEGFFTKIYKNPIPRV